MITTGRTRQRAIIAWIDQTLFPSVVGLMTSRAHIIFLLALIAVVENPYVGIVIALAAGNWTNIISASASSIVLRQQSIQHAVVTEHQTAMLEYHATALDHHESHVDAFDQLRLQISALHEEIIALTARLEKGP